MHELRARRFLVVALTPRTPAIPLEAFPHECSRGIALLVGSEGAGLSAQAAAEADVRVRIPISAAVDSLNASVAAAIALHTIARRTAVPG
jgi:tRNA G18 (ribose-2'-O)-methylase SpoU